MGGAALWKAQATGNEVEKVEVAGTEFPEIQAATLISQPEALLAPFPLFTGFFTVHSHGKGALATVLGADLQLNSTGLVPQQFRKPSIY